MAVTRLSLVPVTLAEANAFVASFHRHSRPVTGHRFCAGVADASRIRGVVIAGRPVAAALSDGWTAEVYRCCTDGARNACSILYGAAWRWMQAAGYSRGITYTLAEEDGASLKASGWRVAATLGTRRGWDTPSRSRDNDQYLSCPRTRWEKGESRMGDRPPLPEISIEPAPQLQLAAA